MGGNEPLFWRGVQHCWVGVEAKGMNPSDVKKLSLEAESYVIIYLEEFFKLSQVLLTSIAVLILKIHCIKFLWFAPSPLH